VGKKMKLALLSIADMESDPPLGLAYIASYLREYGNFGNTIIIDKEDPIERIKKEKPDLVGISSLTHEFPKANSLAKEIKTEFNIPVIIGGQHISLMPTHFIQSNFDIGVIGEGEQTTLELVELFEKEGSFDTKKLKSIKGIVYRNERNALKMTEPRPLIEPLDKIPFPARDLLKMKEYYLTLRLTTFRKFGIYAGIITSRGCPYNCVFCSPTQFWQKCRFHSAKYIVSEIKFLLEKYKLDGVLIFDDLFIANKVRTKQVADLIKKEGINEQVEFYIKGRANLMDDEICRTLKKMNTTVVEFGLESGSEKILNYLKKGTVTVEQNRKALQISRKYGFRTVASFIAGTPNETEEDMKQTLDLMKDNNLQRGFVCQLTPFPGTQIWDYAKQKGIVSDDMNFDYKQLLVLEYKPDLLLNDSIPREKFEKLFFEMKKTLVNKRDRANINHILSLKPKHLRYIITKRFITKIFYYLSHGMELS
jgi:magnesium-protoporphyrin IX monomethyl ester (oxidative) cyclase